MGRILVLLCRTPPGKQRQTHNVQDLESPSYRVSVRKTKGGIELKRFVGWDRLLKPLARVPDAEIAFPPVIGVGAQKSGTTSAFTLLKRHGLQVPSRARWAKEMHAFASPDMSLSEQVDDYRDAFRGLSRPGEWTPTYMNSSRAIQGIYQAFPGARIVIFLRDPVERFFSAVEHGRASGRVDRNLTADGLVERSLSGDVETWWEKSLLGLGVYSKPLERVLRTFPRDQIFIGFFETWTSPQGFRGLAQGLLSFAGFSQTLRLPKTAPVANSREYQLDTARLHPVRRSASADQRLRDYYASERSRLEELLGPIPWD